MKLTAAPRDIFGKKVKSLRKNGLIPAEFYGHNMENRHLSVSEKEFNKVFKEGGEHTVINLEIKGALLPSLISDVQTDPLSQKILAIDFHGVKMDEIIETAVPIVYSGEAPAIKAGFIIVKVMDELDIEALPANIPPSFAIDLSGLAKAGDIIAVKDIPPQNGVKILATPESVIVSVTEKEKEEVSAPPATAAAAPESPAGEQNNAPAETPEAKKE